MELYLNDVCSNYYTLRELLLKQEARFDRLMDKPVVYAGQTDLEDIDKVLKYCYKVQQASDGIRHTIQQLISEKKLILQMLDHFSIPRNTKLKARVGNEAEIHLWADDENLIYYEKLRDILAEEINPNIITIKVCSSAEGFRQDENEDE
jgi:hypothetical protein